MPHHHTDTLGVALDDLRATLSRTSAAVTDASQALIEEREMHRAEVVRLVERAEEAEGACDQLRHQLTAAEREAERLAGVDAGLADERNARRDAEDRADDAERAQRLAEDHQRETARELADLHAAASRVVKVLRHNHTISESRSALAELAGLL